MSIATELSTLAANKAAIKAAIEAKNPATAPTDALSQWPTAIASIPSGPVQQGWIYGYVIDESDSNPATRVTYIEDNADFSPLYMDFANDVLVWGSWQSFVEEYFKPAMLTSAGVIDYYLDPNDLTKKADGETASDVANTSYDGNAMLIVKPIYYNIFRRGSCVEVRFSNVKQGDGWLNWTHLKSNGTYADFCGWPLFTGTVVSSKLRSIATGALPAGIYDLATGYGYATANGSGWYTTTFADEMMMRLLFPLLCKSTNSQGCIGGGALGRSSLATACGAMKTRGYFYGKANVTSSTQYGSKYLGMENVWGERWRRAVGIVGYNGNFFVKLTPSTIDGSKSTFKTSSTLSDYTANYIKGGNYRDTLTGEVIASISADSSFATLPSYIYGENQDINYCDALYAQEDFRFVLFGSQCDAGKNAGIFATYVNNAPADQSWSWCYGCSLSYHFF